MAFTCGKTGHEFTMEQGEYCHRCRRICGYKIISLATVIKTVCGSCRKVIDFEFLDDQGKEPTDGTQDE